MVDSSGAQIKATKSVELEYIALQNLGFLVSIEREEIRPSIALQAVHVEALRAAIWMHSEQGAQSVHINRFLRAAQRLLRPVLEHRGKAHNIYQLADSKDYMDQLADESREASLDLRLYELHRDALEELTRIGDVVELSHGYWQPTPLRAIQLPVSKHWLLIGGVPTSRLPTAVRKQINQNSIVRILGCDPLTVKLQCLGQTLEDWCDQPQISLLEWAEQILYKTTLEPCSMNDSSYSLYVPTKGRSQLERWSRDFSQLQKGRYFAQTIVGAQTTYNIVELKKGKIVAKGRVEWEGGDPVRLCYGIDALNARSSTFTMKPMNDGYISTGTAFTFIRAANALCPRSAVLPE